MKAALLNPEASKSSDKQLASFKGGELSVAEYLRWVRALPPQYNAQLKQANDSVLSQFARVLSLNLLLLRQADSAKVQITGPEWQGLYGRYTSTLDSLKLDMGVAGDSTKGANMDHLVGQYFDRLISGKVRLRPMPGALGTMLRQQSRYRINDPGVSRGLELALAQQQKRDSTGGGAHPPVDRPGLKPAPGPAPVPGAPAPGARHQAHRRRVGRRVPIRRRTMRRRTSNRHSGGMRLRVALLVPALVVISAAAARAQNPADGAPPRPRQLPRPRRRPRPTVALRGPCPRARPIAVLRGPWPRARLTAAPRGPRRRARLTAALGRLRPRPKHLSSPPRSRTSAPLAPPRPTLRRPGRLHRLRPPRRRRPVCSGRCGTRRSWWTGSSQWVGNRPILASQVDEEIFSRQSQGLNPPSSPQELEALRKQVVQSIIDDELMVQEAERDTTIKVTDQEVADGVEQQIKKIRSNFSSELEYASELRKAGFQTPDEYRRWLTDQQRRAALQNRLVDERRGSGKLKSVIPTEREMREYFQQQKGSLEKRPATISFRQIVVAPQPSAEERQRAYQLADSIALGLRRGGDFAVAAKRFSMDSGSRRSGRVAQLVPAGNDGARVRTGRVRAQAGVISDPVETPFGYHIIQVERAQPGEVQARHILIMPEITEQEADSARRLAESLLKAAKAGANFDSLQRIYHDKPEEREAKDVPVTKLPPAYAKAIDTGGAGAVVGPFPLSGSGNRIKYTVVQVTTRRPEGDVRYEDVRDKIRQQLGEQLAVKRYLETLRKKAYVDVRS